MPKVTQLVLTLQSKPGVLATVCKALADAGVNIEALCAPEAPGKGRMRLLVSDAARAEAALKAAKVRAGKEEAITLALENRPGAMAEAARRLAAAKVNIKCAYATTAGPAQATVVLTVSNASRALAALGG
ncbi:MAG TPA: ACT domain-containing protein [Candidatus Methylomirabilis sp.]|jgi:hypothetical protein